MAASEQPSVKKDDCRMLIAGVGNGAGRAVSEMARQWTGGPAMAVINTDAGDIPPVAGLRFVRIGTQVMKGMGTGGDPRVGRRAAAADAEAMRALFKEINLVLLVVGLGGGTGTGAAPLVAEEARRAGALVLCFAMLPFEFEGRRRMEHARHGLLALKEVADGVVCLPNQRLFELVEDRANIAEAFQQADAMLGRALRAVWQILCRQGVINLDFADLRAFLQEGRGACVLGCAEGAGPERVKLALNALREDPMLRRGEALAKADAVLVSIVGGPDLALKDVDALVRGIGEAGRPEAPAVVGVSCDAGLRDRLFVAILAAEKAEASEAQARRPAAPAEPAKLSAGSAPKLTQDTLFDDVEQGRFKGVDPTIVEGNNLDVPAFLRRRIPIQKVRDSHS